MCFSNQKHPCDGKCWHTTGRWESPEAEEEEGWRSGSTEDEWELVDSFPELGFPKEKEKPLPLAPRVLSAAAETASAAAHTASAVVKTALVAAKSAKLPTKYIPTFSEPGRVNPRNKKPNARKTTTKKQKGKETPSTSANNRPSGTRDEDEDSPYDAEDEEIVAFRWSEGPRMVSYLLTSITK